MKNMIKTMLLIAVAVSVVTSCSKDKKETQSEPMPVSVSQPVVLDSVIIYKDFPGLVHASKVSDVVANTSGMIIQKCFTDGQYVTKGQVLYKLDSRAVEAEIAEAKASIASAQSQYDYYKNQAASMRRALAEDAVSKLNVEQAESNMKQAAASMAQAKAQLESARVQLSYCTVKAPISGQTTTGIDNGNFAEAGSTLLCKIINNTDLYVAFSIDDTQFNSLLTEDIGIPGSTLFRNVPLKFDSGVTKEFHTDLNYEAPSVDSATGTVVLQGSVTDPGHQLRDGMFVTVSLPTAVRHKAILVRDASIGTDQLGRYVYLVNDSNKVVYTPIKVGNLYADTLRIVESGIPANARYVKDALLTVRNGMIVSPVSANK